MCSSVCPQQQDLHIPSGAFIRSLCLAGLSSEPLQTSINQKMLLEILDKSFPKNYQTEQLSLQYQSVVTATVSRDILFSNQKITVARFMTIKLLKIRCGVITKIALHCLWYSRFSRWMHCCQRPSQGVSFLLQLRTQVQGKWRFHHDSKSDSRAGSEGLWITWECAGL